MHGSNTAVGSLRSYQVKRNTLMGPLKNPAPREGCAGSPSSKMKKVKRHKSGRNFSVGHNWLVVKPKQNFIVLRGLLQEKIKLICQNSPEEIDGL